MNRAVIIFVFFAIIVTSVFSQIPSNWETHPPRDTEHLKFAVGISAPSNTEQDALRNAWQDAVQQFASSIATHFQGQVDITIQSQSLASGIEDSFTLYMETSSFSTNVPITGVREQARKIETSGGRYIAHVLLSMSIEDYYRARQYVDNEESAYLAYRFFGQRGLFSAAQRPVGYNDYYSWLRNNCIIISIDDQNSNALLEQIDQFIIRLYRSAVVFAQIIDGRNARIIYDSARYYDGIYRALQNTALFNIQRESSHLILRPVRANMLGDLRTAVSSIKDSSRFVITGLETIQTESGNTVNQGAIVINQFRTLISRQYSMQAVNYNIPSQFLSGFVDEDAILRHIQNNYASFPARYLVICRSQTRLEMGMPEFRISPMISASCNFSLYDVVTGESFHSDTVQTAPGVFSISNLENSFVINESRRALQYLYNPRTQPNLETIIKEIFDRL